MTWLIPWLPGQLLKPAARRIEEGGMMCCCTAKVTTVVLIVSLSGQLAVAAGEDPWQNTRVGGVLNLWADGRAAELVGKAKTAARLYWSARRRANDALRQLDPGRERTIIADLRRRAKARLAVLGEQNGALADRPREPRDILVALVRLKAQADRDRAELRADRARASYEVVARAAHLLLKRSPGSDQTKAAAWLEERVKSSLRALAGGKDEKPPEKKDFAGDFKHFTARTLGGDSLKVFRPRIAGPVGLRSRSRRPVRVPGVSSVAAALEEITPLLSGESGGVDIAAGAPEAAARIYLEALNSETTLLASPAAVRDALEAIRAAGVDERVLVNLANDLAARKVDTSAGAITMGAPRAPSPRLLPAVLETYLHVLQTSPEFDRSGALTRKALKTCVQLGKLDERAADLKRRLEKGPPGLLGVLLYRLLRADGRDQAAGELFTAMLADANRFLPKSQASMEALEDGFRLLLSNTKLDAARGAAETLASRDPARTPKRLLSLAEAYLTAERRQAARVLLAKLVADHPLTDEAKRAVTLLGTGKPGGQAAEPRMTDEQLAVLAKLARANPSQYARLAREYRRAGRYAKARKTYKIVARRSDSNQARLAIIETYFEEGRKAEGLRAAEVHIRRYPTARGAAKLRERLRASYLTGEKGTRWAELCLRVAGPLGRRAARPYLSEAAGVLLRCSHMLQPEDRGRDAHAQLMAAVKRSNHAKEVLRLVDREARSLRGKIETLAPLALNKADSRRPPRRAAAESCDAALRQIHNRFLALKQAAATTELTPEVKPVPVAAACQATEETLQEPTGPGPEPENGNVKGAPRNNVQEEP